MGYEGMTVSSQQSSENNDIAHQQDITPLPSRHDCVYSKGNLTDLRKKNSADSSPTYP